MKQSKDISNRSVFSSYQLRRHDYVPAWFGTLKLVTKKSWFSFGYQVVHFYCISVGSIFLRYQQVCLYDVSKASVSFRYQLWRSCNILSWSVSLRYQLVLFLDSQIGRFFYLPRVIEKTSCISMCHWPASL